MIKKYRAKKGFDDFFKGSDEQGNNIMHVSDGKFADKYWRTLVDDGQLDTLVKIVRD